MGFYYGVRATREVDGGSLNLIAKNESVDLDLRELLIHRVRFILDAGGVLPAARRQLPDRLTASHHSSTCTVRRPAFFLKTFAENHEGGFLFGVDDIRPKIVSRGNINPNCYQIGICICCIGAISCAHAQSYIGTVKFT